MKMLYIVRYLICTLLVCVTIGISTVPTSAATTTMSLHSKPITFSKTFSESAATETLARNEALQEKARFERDSNVSCRTTSERVNQWQNFVTAIISTTCSPPPSESFKMQFSWSMFTRELAREFALREKVRFEQEFNVSCRIYDEKGFTTPPGGGVTWLLYTICSPR